METWIILGKYIVTSATLLAFYVIALRRQGSYRLRRQFLILTPVCALLISTLSFRLSFLDSIDVNLNSAPEPTHAVVSVPTDNTFAPTAESNQSDETLSGPTESTISDPTDIVWTNVETTSHLLPALTYTVSDEEPTRDYTALIATLLWIVSALLLLLWCYYLVRVWMLQRNLPKEQTAEGYLLIHSEQVASPFSFGRTIFLPNDLDAESEDIILRHEKAHIAHRHYLELWFIDVLSRLCWFNPIVWMCRAELRNVHEYEADHDVISRGTDTYDYQNTLLQMVLNENGPVVCGFNPSFIRRRFIEMKSSHAGTLTRRGKTLAASGIVLLLCVIGYCSCQLNFQLSSTPRGLEPCPFASMDALPRLDKPQPFTLNFHFLPTDEVKEVYIYHSDDYFRFNSNQPVETLQVVNNYCRYRVLLDHMIAGGWRTDKKTDYLEQLFFVPGEGATYKNSRYKLSKHYDESVRQTIQLVRRLTRYQSPHIPKAHGKRWHLPKCTTKVTTPNPNRPSQKDAVQIRDVFYTDSATIVHIVSKDGRFGLLSNVSTSNRIVDLNTHKRYKFIKTLNSEFYLDARVFGVYAMFEPMEMNFNPFDLKTDFNVFTVEGQQKYSAVLQDGDPEPDDFAARNPYATNELPRYYYKTTSPDAPKVAAPNRIPELQFVQLWKGGPKFATTNVGASQPWQYGDLMNWEKANRAIEQMYEGCRLPTRKDAIDIREHCNSKWIDAHDNQNPGVLVMGRGEYEGKIVFFPAGGDSEGFRANPGRSGYFWTSEDAPKLKYRDNEGYALGAHNSGGIGYTPLDKNLGLSVRLVKD